MDPVDLAGVFRALANPKRLELFRRLLALCGPDGCCCTRDELALTVDRLGSDLGLAKSTVSHHMKELRSAGLIQVARSGKFNVVSFDASILTSLSSFFGSCACGAEGLVPLRDLIGGSEREV
jgi:ArsR family transcriptional regulator, arsenate/arsenite/antimonite-responsive transcriptional repressor